MSSRNGRGPNTTFVDMEQGNDQRADELGEKVSFLKKVNGQSRFDRIRLPCKLEMK
jgi:hypothetical protein